MQNLVNAYLETCYQVRLPCGWTCLHVGQQQLDPLPVIYRNNSRAEEVDLNQLEWLIITACNPQSKQLKNTHNFIRHRLLTQQLQALGMSCYPSRAITHKAQTYWPDEYGWLVISDNWLPVFRLARRFKQNALITHHSCSTVHLCMMRDQNTKISLSEHPYIDLVR